MKLIYISPLRYPSEKAGSLFSVKSCQSFAEEGLEVELWVPRRFNQLSGKDVFEYFGVQKNFKIKHFFVLDLMWLSSGFFNLLSYTFALSVFLYVLFLKIFGKRPDYIFYSHEQSVLLLLSFVSQKTFYEVHDFPSVNKMYQILFKKISGVVATNKWKAMELVKRFKLAKDKIIWISNAVDLKDFPITISKKEVRLRLKISEEDYLIGYVGMLKTMGMEKGLSTAIDSLKFLPSNYILYIVGGESIDIEYYKLYAENNTLRERIIFTGFVPHKNISLHTSVCDCLVAPFPKNDHYSYYMSPMKIFEYMASKRPIIVTDLPSLREVLIDEETALFVPPDSPQALAEAIKRLSGDDKLTSKLVENSYKEVENKYTWQKRAQEILNFLKLENKK